MDKKEQQIERLKSRVFQLEEAAMRLAGKLVVQRSGSTRYGGPGTHFDHPTFRHAAMAILEACIPVAEGTDA